MANPNARKPYVVKTVFKFDGKFRLTGETIHLTDDEYEAYKAHIDGPDHVPGVAYLPGQEPQERGPVDPLTVAQAETGDPVAIADVVGRTDSPPEGRGDVAGVDDAQAETVDEASRAAPVESGYETRPATPTMTVETPAPAPKRSGTSANSKSATK